MTDITKLPPGVERRKCAGCGYLMTQVQVDAARLDFPCPRCRKHTLRDFVLDTPPKPGKRKAT